MMRVPVIAPKDYTADQKELAEILRGSISSFLTSFTTSRKDGALIGPFNNMLRFPVLGKAAWQLFLAINAHRVLPPFAHEICILVTGARFGSMYELYSHESVAAATKALTPSKIATLAAGQRPTDLTEQEGITYDVVAVLNGGTQIPQSTYDRAVKAFGEDGVAEMTYLVGVYSTICLVLNAFDVSLPGTELGDESSEPSEERKLPEFRKNLEELKALKPTGGSGSSGEQGVLEITVMGDPDKTGPYVQLLRVPPHTKVAAHYHSRDRVATVLSGSWHFGFGDEFDEKQLKHLPPGSIYTEPDKLPHFAMTDETEAVVQLSGEGPTDTTYVNPNDDPAKQKEAKPSV